MINPRDPGATFQPRQLGWIDWETRSPVDIKKTSAYRYVSEADAIICAYAIGDEPATAVSVTADTLRWDDMPEAVKAHHARVVAGDATWVAWNAGFDRAVWNYAASGFPVMLPTHIIDAMAQALAAGLPGGLDDAGRHCRCGRKKENGNALIKLFQKPVNTASTHPIEWDLFVKYAIQDIEVMRNVFKVTRQLPKAEWQEYWVSETINDRGIGVDLTLAHFATEMAKVAAVHAAKKLKYLTKGAVTAVTQPIRMIKWLDSEFDDMKCREIMARTEDEIDEETGAIINKGKQSLDRARLRLLIANLTAREPRTQIENDALDLLTLRLYGGSTTPAKFKRMADSSIDGVLMGSYVFNGAGQTGRYSSKTTQIHNLMRDALPYEIDALDALCAGASYEAFERLGDDTPVVRKLSMLIRPALVPTSGEVFVWGDWSQIEARVLPWLEGGPGGEDLLDIFRACDADPSLPDLYVRTAAAMTGLSVEEITAELRQRGKVAVLACGYGGGLRALQNMAAAYNINLDDALAREIVRQWRDANQWAVKFWGKHDRENRISYGLWGAANKAIERPGDYFEAGRVGYIFVASYLGGSLLCRLPSGRFLTYRAARWELIEEKNDKGEIIDVRRELTFARGHGRIKIWPGILAENVTQAASADVLRETLTVMVKQGFDVRGHTHDEALIQVPEVFAKDAARQLQAIMEKGFDWSKGLPLRAETTVARWYTKSKNSTGL